MLPLNAPIGSGRSAGEPVTTGLVSDPSSYGSLAKSARSGDRAGIEGAARAFESLLLGQMLKQMRTSSLGEGLFDSEQTKIYQDLSDQQVASKISEGDGMGIRQALLRQLLPAESVKETASVAQPANTLKIPERNPSLRSYRRQVPDAASTAPAGAPTASASAAAAPSQIDISGTQGRWPPRDAAEFLAYLKPYADQAAATLGMDTSVLLAQSALETGWGKHVPRHADGRSSFNLFGIKADRSWEGDKVAVGTLEYRNGMAQRERAKFRAYDSPAESFVDYVAFLRRNPRYRNALASTSGEAFIRGLQQAGYATDPQYASKILGIRDRLARLSASADTQVATAQADTKRTG